MNQTRRFRACLRAAIPLVVISAGTFGCGGSDAPPTHQVNGVVLYNDEPMPNVAVTFYPEDGRSAVGKTDSEGRFQLTTFVANDGAVAGEHKVAVVAAPGEAAGKETGELKADDYAPQATGKSPIPKKYFTRETTTLKVRIPDDLENGELKLKLTD